MVQIGWWYNMSYDKNKCRAGWDRLNSDSMGDITWTEATRTFTIAPKAGQSEFTFWSCGMLFSKQASESVVIPDVSGNDYVDLRKNKGYNLPS
jgi:hypothetical protein